MTPCTEAGSGACTQTSAPRPESSWPARSAASSTPCAASPRPARGGGNTFITITPADDDPAWYASVTLLPTGTYQVERADPARGEQHRDTTTGPSHIARDLTIWLAARHHPGRPARSNTDF
jgi:hypothetical protein